MWLQLLPIILLLSDSVYAQGDDTIKLSDITDKPSINAVEVNFAFNGKSGHQLHNVSLELVAAEDSGAVLDILGINYSEKGDITYQLRTGINIGPFLVRANGTIYSGATVVSNTTALSSLPVYVQLQEPDPCKNVTFVAVHSPADPAYTPWRIIQPAGFSVFQQKDLAAPDAAIKLALYQVDQLADSLAEMTATVEMVNNATGASVGVQTLNPKNLFPTTNLTLDPGAWKLRANFTSTSARNAGTFTAYSEEFYIKGANPPLCLAAAKVAPVASTNAGSSIAIGPTLPLGLCGLVWVVAFSVTAVF